MRLKQKQKQQQQQRRLKRRQNEWTRIRRRRFNHHHHHYYSMIFFWIYIGFSNWIYPYITNNNNISLLLHRPIQSLFASASTTTEVYDEDDEDDDESDDYLKEILEEERKREENYATVEAEARMYEEMMAEAMRQQNQQNQNQQGRGRMPNTTTTNKQKTKPKSNKNDNLGNIEEELRQKEEEMIQRKLEEETILEQKRAKERRIQKEKDFENELLLMKTEEERRIAKKQKQMDATIVRKILRSSKQGRHYAVLGLSNFHISIPYPSLIGINIIRRRGGRGGGSNNKSKKRRITLFRKSTLDIKRAYRQLARRVHPDKNKDGNADLAFDALERSAAILSDEKQRAEYDRKIARQRRERNERWIQRFVNVLDYGWNGILVRGGVWINRFLGPFSTPILVLGTILL